MYLLFGMQHLVLVIAYLVFGPFFTWTKTVTRTPIITPTIGLFSRSEFLKKATKKENLAVKTSRFYTGNSKNPKV